MLLIRDLVLGTMLGIAFILAVRRWAADQLVALSAIGLAVAALIYVGFALIHGAPMSWLRAEIGAFCAFGMLAWVGWRREAAWLIALGFGLHPLWDTLLHWGGPGAMYTPRWYVVQCLSFDLLIAAYVLTRRTNLRFEANRFHPFGQSHRR